MKKGLQAIHTTLGKNLPESQLARSIKEYLQALGQVLKGKVPRSANDGRNEIDDFRNSIHAAQSTRHSVHSTGRRLVVNPRPKIHA